MSWLICFRRLFIACALALFCAESAQAAPFVVRDDYRSPRNKDRPRRKATRLIVLHTTEAHAKSALNKLSERGEANYCVTERGEIYRIVDQDREAFHAGCSMWDGREECDTFSVGIEVVGYHDKAMPLRQLTALKELVTRLKRTYNIPDAQVVAHSHVAYGSPNQWHKRKHRGRKRCGMLFAMPSVRAKLGLKARPAYDPDVRAHRLVQGDAYLETVLYGKTDTMMAYYGRAVRQQAVTPAMPTVAQGSTRVSSQMVVKVVPVPKGPPVAGHGVVKVVPVGSASNAPSATTSAPSATVMTNEEDSIFVTMGLTGQFFKKKNIRYVPAAAPTSPPPSAAESAPLPLPKNLSIGRVGDDVKDLKALAELPGYVRGGPVNAQDTPFKIAGAAWKSSTTYYYARGKITRGDKIDEKAVEPGTFIFYKK